jgi:hypothetical protein
MHNTMTALLLLYRNSPSLHPSSGIGVGPGRAYGINVGTVPLESCA